jgi:hypothetical protein
VFFENQESRQVVMAQPTNQKTKITLSIKYKITLWLKYNRKI